MANDIEIIEANMELLDPGTANALARVEIMQQVATAKSFPRDVDTFKRETKSLACESEDVALEMIYRLERGNKPIEGPSIRFAEILMHSWRNSRAGSRLLHIGDEYLTAQGVFQDFERNITTTAERQRRITTSEGRRYSVDMIVMTANAAGSIALRESILRGIPKPFWLPAMMAARALVSGDTRSIGSRRDSLFRVFEGMNVKPDRVLAYLGVKGQSDVDAQAIIRMRGIAQAIRDEDTTVDQVFGRRDADNGERNDIGKKLREAKNEKTAEPIEDRGESDQGEDAAGADAEAAADKNGEAFLAEYEATLSATTTHTELQTALDEFSDTVAHQAPAIRAKAASLATDHNKRIGSEKPARSRRSLAASTDL